MPCKVVLADTAKADADRMYAWITAEAPVHGPQWFEELTDSLHSLERLPQRCPLARESAKARRPIRCLLFGKRHGVYRILYEVDERTQTVWILHIRHGALQDLRPGELTALPKY
jgi:plasmid stabilization system protein ParE